MKVTVQFTGYVRVELGRKEMDLNLPDGASLGDAVSRLIEVIGPAADQAIVGKRPGGFNVIFGLNGRPVDVSTVLAEGDQVAILPPMAGGSGRNGVGAAGDE